MVLFGGGFNDFNSLYVVYINEKIIIKNEITFVN